MVSLQLSQTRQIEALYDDSEGELEFSSVLSSTQIDDDGALAELIEIDGRERLTRGLYVDLQRYLDAVPDLPRRSIALDSAVDFSLRSLSGEGEASSHFVDTLVDNYPFLEQQIREAAALNNALWSTSGIRQQLQPQARRLPSGFGPQTANGLYRYELRELLGTGAAGQVYLAVDRLLSDESHQATVAIKILADRNRTVWGRQQLSDEATKARRITHPNVVRVLDRGITDSNEDFLVFECIEGGDLSGWLAKHGPKVEPRKAAQMLLTIARGIHAAHIAGLIHCDLKPSNILLTDDGAPKVTDFGVAMRIGDNSLDMAGHRANAPVGNLAFISPEQFRMEPGMTAAPSDVYALGGLLYYMLTGNLPNGQTAAQITEAHSDKNVQSSRPELSSLTKGLSPTLNLICTRALAVDPGDRHHSAGELADDLEAWLNHEPIRWTKPSPRRILTLWATRNPGTMAATLLLITAIAAGAGSTRFFANSATSRQMNEARALYELELNHYETSMIGPMVQNMAQMLGADMGQSDIGNSASLDDSSKSISSARRLKQSLLQRQETLERQVGAIKLEQSSVSPRQIEKLIELACIYIKTDRADEADLILENVAEQTQSNAKAPDALKNEIAFVQMCREVDGIILRTRTRVIRAGKTITQKDHDAAEKLAAALSTAFYRHQWDIKNIQASSLVHTRLLDLYGPWGLNRRSDYEALSNERFDPTSHGPR